MTDNTPDKYNFEKFVAKYAGNGKQRRSKEEIQAYRTGYMAGMRNTNSELIAAAEIEARIDENKYYAELLKLNEKSADDATSIKVSLRKIFQYRLNELQQEGQK